MFRCIICNTTNYQIINKKTRDSKQNVVQCKSCEHVQLFPLMTSKQIREYYDKDRQLRSVTNKTSIKEMRDKAKSDLKNRYELISKYARKNSKILEIGSGYGFLLELMKRKGFTIEGVEISKIRRNYSSKKIKCKIHNIDFSCDQSYNIGKYDMIIMVQVLEHIVNPIKFLKNVKSVLKESGKLIIEVPNLDDVLLNINPNYREWFWQTAHVSYYDVKSLKNVLKKSGFKNYKFHGLQRYGIENMFYWKILGKPQLQTPSKKIDNELMWLEKIYKEELEKRKISDTIVCIAKK